MKDKPKCYPFLFLGVVLLLASLVAACQPSPPPPPPAPPVIAASSSSLSFSAEQARTNLPSLTLEIHNSGAGTLNWSATDDADWLTLSPTSGNSTGETNNLTVAVNIAGISPGDYSATITISAPEASNSPQTVSVNLTITPIMPTVSYDMSLTVSPVSQTGSPGDTLHYTVTVTNRGTEADTYDLSVSDNQGWTLTAPSTTSQIASVASQAVTLSLTIPQDAAAETGDEITIIATSQNDPTASDSAVCTAVVIQEPPPPTISASVSISPSSTTKSPGDTFEISVLVDAADYVLMGIDIAVSFDSEAMSTSEAQVTKHNLLGGMEIGPTVKDGKVTYALVNTTPQAHISGSVMTIEFTIAENASGSYDLTITKADLVNENGEIISAVVTNDGLITVQ